MKLKNELNSFVYLVVTVKSIIVAVMFVMSLFTLTLGSTGYLYAALILTARMIGVLIIEWITIIKADDSKLFSILLILLGFINGIELKIISVIVAVVYILYGLVCFIDLLKDKKRTV